VLAHTGTLEGTGSGLELPGLAALGVGALACAALTRRARRTRLLRQVTTEVPDPGFPLSESAIDTSILLARGAGLPALRAFEAANYGLAAALPGRSDGTVTVRAVCVGPAGVDFWMAEAGRPAPDGLTLSPDGRVWHAAHGVFSAERTGRPLLPIVLPVGEDDRGTWLVPLGQGCTLSLLGESAPALWRAARPVQEAWSWADMVLVTEDAHVASGEVQLRGDGDDPGADATQVLFFGDPAELTDAVAQRVAIVTLTCAPSSDVTVLVDRRGASIHPLGRTVRPHLMDDTTARAVRELVEPVAPLDTGAEAPSFGASPPPVAPDRPATASTDDHAPREKARAVAAHVRRPPMAGTFSPSLPVPDVGAVEVRLLTRTPRLEGLVTALPPNRTRRAVELVAYLASHAGEEVTSDRLRTRVLGSADTDAASKTLFNTAAAARRAMGLDATGNPLFPFGTRTGHYRVADGVTTDVQRVTSLALAGSSTEDPDTAMALLRSALDLVEGEPMANVYGYTWWEVEGHRPGIAAVLVNAAGNLAALAIEAELFELAQWGLAQARLVEPYSEPISRAAMQVAAAAGDVDRLRREWGDYRRRLDELDPGSAPHPRAERLYGELSRLVLAGAPHRALTSPGRRRSQGGDQASLAAMDEAPRRTRPSDPEAL
jgi:DNA-binding SARP family transcriptional activator